jgi:hypothetical protein
LYEFFEEYQPTDSFDFEDALDFLMGDYPSLDQNRINDMSLVGGDIFYGFLVEITGRSLNISRVQINQRTGAIGH